MSDPAPDPIDQTEGMTLGEHLDELRSRLFKGVVVIVVLFFVAWFYRDPIDQVLEGPYKRFVSMYRTHWVEEVEQRIADDPELVRTDFFLFDDPDDDRLLPQVDLSDKLQVTGGSEAFVFKLKGCLYASMFVGGPFLLWQLWGFIAAGLYKKERRTVLTYFPSSIVLFFSGIAFGYFVMVPYALYFLGMEAPPDLVDPGYRKGEYLAFMSSLCLALGFVFQLPIVQTALARVELVRPKTFAHYRGHFALASFVLAAMITPPDPITQSLMAGPMIVLYEIGIWAAYLAAPKSIIPEGELEADA